MRPILNGNIIFVFSDPGGAKPCLSLIELNNIVTAVAVSDRSYPFYNDFQTQVKLIKGNYVKFIDNICPDLIFTGTSYTSNIEQQFIKIALDKNIPCYSYVDHWTSISNRFRDSEGNMILPDKIWVIDERAKKIALEEGIEESKLVISGNPYHDWLRDWRPNLTKEEFLSEINFKNESQKLLVYAPDPLSNINGKDIYGFDELSATSTIIDLFECFQNELQDWSILVKLHPNQNKLRLLEIISDRIFILPDDVDANTTIYYSDAVLGFFSSFLIEASVMNKPVIRFLEKSIKNDPIAELNIGCISNKSNFVEMLLKVSYEKE